MASARARCVYDDEDDVGNVFLMLSLFGRANTRRDTTVGCARLDFGLLGWRPGVWPATRSA